MKMSYTTHIESVGSRHYYVVTSKAAMPSSVKSGYTHSAVVAVDGAPVAPKVIRETRTQSVLWDSGPGYDGRTLRCAGARNQDRARDLALEYARNRRARLAREADEAAAEAIADRSGEEV